MDNNQQDNHGIVPPPPITPSVPPTTQTNPLSPDGYVVNPSPKKSNTALIVGIIVSITLIIVAVVVVLFITLGNKQESTGRDEKNSTSKQDDSKKDSYATSKSGKNDKSDSNETAKISMKEFSGQNISFKYPSDWTKEEPIKVSLYDEQFFAAKIINNVDPKRLELSGNIPRMNYDSSSYPVKVIGNDTRERHADLMYAQVNPDDANYFLPVSLMSDCRDKKDITIVKKPNKIINDERTGAEVTFDCSLGSGLTKIRVYQTDFLSKSNKEIRIVIAAPIDYWDKNKSTMEEMISSVKAK